MSRAQSRLRLFTPGPLNTTRRVRAALREDWGSRTPEFSELTQHVRQSLLSAAGAGPAFTAVPLQGSGTFAVEAMLATFVPNHARVLVLANGAYGERLADICSAQCIDHAVLRGNPARPLDVGALENALAGALTFSHVAFVHCETSAGVINPADAIVRSVGKQGCRALVDAMSAFGALKLDYAARALSAVAASANKCLHGVPGVGFVVSRKSDLERATARRSLSLDLRAQWKELERSGQWRFTPPTHVLAALKTALDEFHDEGGADARLRRYEALCSLLVGGMERLGFQCIVDEAHRAPMITAFSMPAGSRLNFDTLFRALSDSGLSIYPSKMHGVDGFRVGCMGDLAERDIRDLLSASADVLEASKMPAPAAAEC